MPLTGSIVLVVLCVALFALRRKSRLPQPEDGHDRAERRDRKTDTTGRNAATGTGIARANPCQIASVPREGAGRKGPAINLSLTVTRGSHCSLLDSSSGSTGLA